MTQPTINNYNSCNSNFKPLNPSQSRSLNPLFDSRPLSREEALKLDHIFSSPLTYFSQVKSTNNSLTFNFVLKTFLNKLGNKFTNLGIVPSFQLHGSAMTHILTSKQGAFNDVDITIFLNHRGQIDWQKIERAFLETLEEIAQVSCQTSSQLEYEEELTYVVENKQLFTIDTKHRHLFYAAGLSCLSSVNGNREEFFHFTIPTKGKKIDLNIVPIENSENHTAVASSNCFIIDILPLLHYEFSDCIKNKLLHVATLDKYNLEEALALLNKNQFTVNEHSKGKFEGFIKLLTKGLLPTSASIEEQFCQTFNRQHSLTYIKTDYERKLDKFLEHHFEDHVAGRIAYLLNFKRVIESSSEILHKKEVITVIERLLWKTFDYRVSEKQDAAAFLFSLIIIDLISSHGSIEQSTYPRISIPAVEDGNLLSAFFSFHTSREILTLLSHWNHFKEVETVFKKYLSKFKLEERGLDRYLQTIKSQELIDELEPLKNLLDSETFDTTTFTRSFFALINNQKSNETKFYFFNAYRSILNGFKPSHSIPFSHLEQAILTNGNLDVALQKDLNDHELWKDTALELGTPLKKKLNKNDQNELFFLNFNQKPKNSELAEEVLEILKMTPTSEEVRQESFLLALEELLSVIIDPNPKLVLDIYSKLIELNLLKKDDLNFLAHLGKCIRSNQKNIQDAAFGNLRKGIEYEVISSSKGLFYLDDPGHQEVLSSLFVLLKKDSSSYPQVSEKIKDFYKSQNDLPDFTIDSFFNLLSITDSNTSEPLFIQNTTSLLKALFDENIDRLKWMNALLRLLKNTSNIEQRLRILTTTERILKYVRNESISLSSLKLAVEKEANFTHALFSDLTQLNLTNDSDAEALEKLLLEQDFNPADFLKCFLQLLKSSQDPQVQLSILSAYRNLLTLLHPTYFFPDKFLEEVIHEQKSVDVAFFHELKASEVWQKPLLRLSQNLLKNNVSTDLQDAILEFTAYIKEKEPKKTYKLEKIFYDKNLLSDQEKLSHLLTSFDQEPKDRSLGEKTIQILKETQSFSRISEEDKQHFLDSLFKLIDVLDETSNPILISDIYNELMRLGLPVKDLHSHLSLSLRAGHEKTRKAAFLCFKQAISSDALSQEESFKLLISLLHGGAKERGSIPDVLSLLSTLCIKDPSYRNIILGEVVKFYRSQKPSSELIHDHLFDFFATATDHSPFKNGFIEKTKPFISTLLQENFNHPQFISTLFELIKMTPGRENRLRILRTTKEVLEKVVPGKSFSIQNLEKSIEKDEVEDLTLPLLLDLVKCTDSGWVRYALTMMIHHFQKSNFQDQMFQTAGDLLQNSQIPLSQDHLHDAFSLYNLIKEKNGSLSFDTLHKIYLNFLRFNPSAVTKNNAQGLIQFASDFIENKECPSLSKEQQEEILHRLPSLIACFKHSPRYSEILAIIRQFTFTSSEIISELSLILKNQAIPITLEELQETWKITKLWYFFINDLPEKNELGKAFVAIAERTALVDDAKMLGFFKELFLQSTQYQFSSFEPSLGVVICNLYVRTSLQHKDENVRNAALSLYLRHVDQISALPLERFAPTFIQWVKTKIESEKMDEKWDSPTLMHGINKITLAHSPLKEQFLKELFFTTPYLSEAWLFNIYLRGLKSSISDSDDYLKAFEALLLHFIQYSDSNPPAKHATAFSLCFIYLFHLSKDFNKKLSKASLEALVLAGRTASYYCPGQVSLDNTPFRPINLLMDIIDYGLEGKAWDRDSFAEAISCLAITSRNWSIEQCQRAFTLFEKSTFTKPSLIHSEISSNILEIFTQRAFFLLNPKVSTDPFDLKKLMKEKEGSQDVDPLLPSLTPFYYIPPVSPSALSLENESSIKYLHNGLMKIYPFLYSFIKNNHANEKKQLATALEWHLKLLYCSFMKLKDKDSAQASWLITSSTELFHLSLSFEGVHSAGFYTAAEEMMMMNLYSTKHRSEWSELSSAITKFTIKSLTLPPNLIALKMKFYRDIISEALLLYRTSPEQTRDPNLIDFALGMYAYASFNSPEICTFFPEIITMNYELLLYACECAEKFPQGRINLKLNNENDIFFLSRYTFNGIEAYVKSSSSVFPRAFTFQRVRPNIMGITSLVNSNPLVFDLASFTKRAVNLALKSKNRDLIEYAITVIELDSLKKLIGDTTEYSTQLKTKLKEMENETKSEKKAFFSSRRGRRGRKK